MSDSQGTYLYVQWDTSDTILLSYYLVINGEVKVNGYYSLRANPNKILKSLNSMAKKYGIERFIIQNSLGLSKEKLQKDGLGATESQRWMLKLRKVDQIFQSLTQLNNGFSYEIKDGVYSPVKCSLGRFIKINENGEALFENVKIKIPRSVLEYAAYLFESLIAPGITFIRYVDDKKENKENYVIRLAQDKKISVPLEKNFKGYLVIWLREEENELVANISTGRTLSEAMKKHKKIILKKMIEWINKSKETSFLTSIVTLDHIKINELIRKIKEK